MNYKLLNLLDTCLLPAVMFLSAFVCKAKTIGWITVEGWRMEHGSGMEPIQCWGRSRIFKPS